MVDTPICDHCNRPVFRDHNKGYTLILRERVMYRLGQSEPENGLKIMQLCNECHAMNRARIVLRPVLEDVT